MAPGGPHFPADEHDPHEMSGHKIHGGNATSAQGMRATSARDTPTQGYEDVVVLAQSGFGEGAEQLMGFCRDHLLAVGSQHREAAVLSMARHALTMSRTSGRPSLMAYACKSVAKTTLPKVLVLCHSDFPSYEWVHVPYHDNGLFANILQVCDALLLSKPEASVLVDWQRKGEEGHFQYGPATFDLWSYLFVGSSRCRSLADLDAAPDGAGVMPSRVNCVFMNMLRGYFWSLPAAELSKIRRQYKSAMSVMEHSDRVRSAVEDICGSWELGACAVVGVHKRLDTPEVAACQLSQRNPPSAEFISKAREILSAPAHRGKRHVLFLATDDEKAVRAFSSEFPDGSPIELVIRSGVKRSEGGVRDDGIDDEVHRSPCEATSLYVYRSTNQGTSVHLERRSPTVTFLRAGGIDCIIFSDFVLSSILRV